MILVPKQIFNDTKSHESYDIDDFQDIYDKFAVYNLHAYVVKSPCCGSPEIIAYGYYERSLMINGKEKMIRLHRIQCKQCGRTHAVFLIDLIPYTFLNQKEALMFFNGEDIKAYVGLIKESFLRAMLKRIKKLKDYYLANFKELLKANKLLEINIELIKESKMLFCQIHRGEVFINEAPT